MKWTRRRFNFLNGFYSTFNPILLFQVGYEFFFSFSAVVWMEGKGITTASSSSSSNSFFSFLSYFLSIPPQRDIRLSWRFYLISCSIQSKKWFPNFSVIKMIFIYIWIQAFEMILNRSIGWLSLYCHLCWLIWSNGSYQSNECDIRSLMLTSSALNQGTLDHSSWIKSTTFNWLGPLSME